MDTIKLEFETCFARPPSEELKAIRDAIQTSIARMDRAKRMGYTFTNKEPIDSPLVEINERRWVALAGAAPVRLTKDVNLDGKGYCICLEIHPAVTGPPFPSEGYAMLSVYV